VDDRTLTEHITELVAEEQRLQEQPDHSPERLHEVEVTLDRLWDLLRQRRSREQYGLDPNAAVQRDTDTVEKYLQ
jgi:hypothetical protein